MKPTAQIGAVPVMRGPRIQSSPDRVGRRNDRFSIQAGRGERAFSLIEIMVTVGLLSFIILGLLAMFNQTQRAFKSSITQIFILHQRLVGDAATARLLPCQFLVKQNDVTSGACQ